MMPPPHEPASPLGLEMTNPAGRVSLKPMFVRSMPPGGLVIVKLSVVEPLRGMVATPKVLAITCVNVTPAPLSANDCGLSPPSSLTLNVATSAPTIVRKNLRLIVHVPELATVGPQVVDTAEKSPEFAPLKTKEDVRTVLPELFVNVTTVAPLWLPTTWSPNDTRVGFSLRGRVCNKMKTLEASLLTKARSKAPS